MDNSSCIDLSLVNVWQSWFKFRKGKKRSWELEEFSYYLESNLHQLYLDLNSGQYRHGNYRKFIDIDNKKREVSIAPIRDRVAHRLLYEYLVSIYDKTFIPDVWSCRKGKGVVGAISRTQKLLSLHNRSFAWRSDIKKFFDNVDRQALKDIIRKKIIYPVAIEILDEVIDSYHCCNRSRAIEGESKITRKGIPIGNLTSQIFANIYLNELDKFVVNKIKPQAYLRYGDDFFIIMPNKDSLIKARITVKDFLTNNLDLELHSKNDIIVKSRWGLHFLGVDIFPKGRRLNGRNQSRIFEKINLKNVASYSGIVKKYGNHKLIKKFNWRVLEILEK